MRSLKSQKTAPEVAGAVLKSNFTKIEDYKLILLPREKKQIACGSKAASPYGEAGRSTKNLGDVT